MDICILRLGSSSQQKMKSLWLSWLHTNLEGSLDIADSVIGIIGASHIEIRNCVFDSNWHKEFEYSILSPVFNSSQIISFKFFNGDFVFANNQVLNHKGMYTNSFLLEAFPEIPFASVEGKIGR